MVFTHALFQRDASSAPPPVPDLTALPSFPMAAHPALTFQSTDGPRPSSYIFVPSTGACSVGSDRFSASMPPSSSVPIGNMLTLAATDPMLPLSSKQASKHRHHHSSSLGPAKQVHYWGHTAIGPEPCHGASPLVPVPIGSSLTINIDLPQWSWLGSTSPYPHNILALQNLPPTQIRSSTSVLLSPPLTLMWRLSIHHLPQGI